MTLFLTLNSFLFFFLVLLYFRGVKKRKMEQSSFLSLFEEGILILKKDGKIAYSNRAFYKILGANPSERNFLLISKAINQELLEKSQELIQRVAKQSEQLRETFFNTTQEGSSMVNLIAYAIDHQTRVLILKDIHQDQREFSLGKEFIANASHELRTPITIIKGFVETLKDLPEISDVMLEDIFEKILRNCKRMDDIVKNLLILTDLDHLYKPNKEPFELYSILDNSRHMIQEIYPH
jgi:PAS domain S-box-containing protein